MKSALSLLLLTFPAFADTLAVQGRLSNLGGGVDGNYPMVFKLFDTASGTTPLFQEIEVSVPVADGAFSTLLGDGVALSTDVLDHAALWIEITIGAEPPLPRTQISHVAKAFVANRSRDLACTGCVTPEETSFMGCTDGSILVKESGAWSCAPRPTGKDFALSNQSCLAGQVIRGFKADGTPICVSDNDTTYSGANFAVSGAGCPAGQVMTGVGTDGSPSCAADKDTTYSGANFALAGQQCASGQVARGVDASGKPICIADKDTTYDGSTFALSAQQCAAGQVARGVDATGKPICIADKDSTYNGANFALSNKSCAAGSVVKGIDASGNPLCEANPTYTGANFAVSNKSCAAGSVVKGIDTSGNPVCETNPTYNGNNFATSNQACAANQYVSGINATGGVVCKNLSDYMDTNCHVYFGWRDNCDACTTAPLKYGYANAAACNAVGVNSNCITSTINGKSVRLMGINTDGDVNDDDKFYIGFRCD